MLKEDKLSHYIETYQIEWADPLPDNCPPEYILIPEAEEFYRLLLNEDKIVEDDWKTYTQLYPDQAYIGEKLILASGLSVNKDGDFNRLTKLSYMKRFKGIALIKLNPTDGVLKKTKGKNHYTWWRTTSFDTDKAEIINK